jgi:hypothetical protein
LAAAPAGAQQSALPDVEAEVQDVRALLSEVDYFGGNNLTLLRQDLARISRDLGAASQEPGIFEARLKVQDLLTSLTMDNSLSGVNLAAARGVMLGVETDLQLILERTGQGGGWQEYDQAALDYWPDTAVFTGWRQDRQFNASTDDNPGELIFTVQNGYTAEWAIGNAFSGKPSVQADARPNGDLFITVESGWGRRDFLIENGGLGPLNFGGTIPEAATAAAPSYDEQIVAYPDYVYPDYSYPDNYYYFDFGITVLPPIQHLPHRWHDHGGPGQWNHWDQQHHGGEHNRPPIQHIDHDRPPIQHLDHGHDNGNHNNGGGHNGGNGNHNNGGNHNGGNGNNHGHDNGNQPGDNQQNPPPPINHGDQRPPRPRDDNHGRQPEPRHGDDQAQPAPPPPAPKNDHARPTRPTQHDDDAQPAPPPKRADNPPPPKRADNPPPPKREERPAPQQPPIKHIDKPAPPPPPAPAPPGGKQALPPKPKDDTDGKR